ncbi:unnamed protein product [Symbiodinium sp. CCMP2592]|nr:unnamed protein product [Symbiodinium sp. CCMP2592]
MAGSSARDTKSDGSDTGVPSLEETTQQCDSEDHCWAHGRYPKRWFVTGLIGVPQGSTETGKEPGLLQHPLAIFCATTAQGTYEDRGWRDRGDSYRGYWQGAYRTREKEKERNSPQAKGKGKAFPTYDVDWHDAAGISVMAERRHPEPSTKSAFSKVVQDAVNLLRKAETRISKLHSELQEKSRRWEAYQVELKQSFVKEYQKHLGALDKLEQDIADASAQEISAKEVLARAMEGVKPPTTQTQATQAWDSMMRSLQGPADMDVDADTLGLRLDALLSGARLPDMGHQEKPLAEPGPAEPVGAAFGPVRSSYVGSSPSAARADPYLATSPAATLRAKSPPRETPKAAPGPRIASPVLPMDAAAVEAVRALKESVGLPTRPQATGPASPRASNLADKLQQARRSAMAPFGLAPAMEGAGRAGTGPPRAGPTATEAGRPPEPHGRTPTIDLDLDEELDSASPGLGRME